MPDVTRHFRKAREELSRFQQQLHAKQLEREKLAKEIGDAETQIRQIRTLERETRMKRSLLGRLDLEINRLNAQKKRIDREAPAFEREFEKMKQERRFGKRTI